MIPYEFLDNAERVVKAYDYYEESEGVPQNPTLILSTSVGWNISFVLHFDEDIIRQTALPLEVKGGFLSSISSFFSRSSTKDERVPTTRFTLSDKYL